MKCTSRTIANPERDFYTCEDGNCIFFYWADGRGNSARRYQGPNRRDVRQWRTEMMPMNDDVLLYEVRMIRYCVAVMVVLLLGGVLLLVVKN